jgi:hypothetical protein
MGDDGFLRRLAIRIHQPLLYGDALVLGGTVTDRFLATDEGPHTYRAVLIDLTATNQLGEMVLSGEAVVLLPDPGRPVVLPIGHAFSCEPLATSLEPLAKP